MKNTSILEQYINTLIDLTKEIKLKLYDCAYDKYTGFTRAKISQLTTITNQIDSIIDLIYQRGKNDSHFDEYVNSLIKKTLNDNENK